MDLFSLQLKIFVVILLQLSRFYTYTLYLISETQPTSQDCFLLG